MVEKLHKIVTKLKVSYTIINYAHADLKKKFKQNLLYSSTTKIHLNLVGC